jgi:hypothetical protein
VLFEIFTDTDVALEFSFKFRFGGIRVVCTCNYCSWILTYNLLQGTKIRQPVFQNTLEMSGRANGWVSSYRAPPNFAHSVIMTLNILGSAHTSYTFGMNAPNKWAHSWKCYSRSGTDKRIDDTS